MTEAETVKANVYRIRNISPRGKRKRWYGTIRWGNIDPWDYCLDTPAHDSIADCKFDCGYMAKILGIKLPKPEIEN